MTAGRKPRPPATNPRTPTTRSRTGAGRPRATDMSPHRFAQALAAGEDSAVLVGECAAAVAAFLRASTMPVDAQRMVLEMLTDELDDMIAEDSATWCETRIAVFPHLRGRE